MGDLPQALRQVSRAPRGLVIGIYSPRESPELLLEDLEMRFGRVQCAALSVPLLRLHGGITKAIPNRGARTPLSVVKLQFTSEDGAMSVLSALAASPVDPAGNGGPGAPTAARFLSVSASSDLDIQPLSSFSPLENEVSIDLDTLPHRQPAASLWLARRLNDRARASHDPTDDLVPSVPPPSANATVPGNYLKLGSKTPTSDQLILLPPSSSPHSNLEEGKSEPSMASYRTDFMSRDDTITPWTNLPRRQVPRSAVLLMPQSNQLLQQQQQQQRQYQTYQEADLLDDFDNLALQVSSFALVTPTSDREVVSPPWKQDARLASRPQWSAVGNSNSSSSSLSSGSGSGSGSFAPSSAMWPGEAGNEQEPSLSSPPNAYAFLPPQSHSPPKSHLLGPGAPSVAIPPTATGPAAAAQGRGGRTHNHSLSSTSTSSSSTSYAARARQSLSINSGQAAPRSPNPPQSAMFSTSKSSPPIYSPHNSEHRRSLDAHSSYSHSSSSSSSTSTRNNNNNGSAYTQANQQRPRSNTTVSTATTSSKNFKRQSQGGALGGAAGAGAAGQDKRLYSADPHKGPRPTDWMLSEETLKSREARDARFAAIVAAGLAPGRTKAGWTQARRPGKRDRDAAKAKQREKEEEEERERLRELLGESAGAATAPITVASASLAGTVC